MKVACGVIPTRLYEAPPELDWSDLQAAQFLISARPSPRLQPDEGFTTMPSSMS